MSEAPPPDAIWALGTSFADLDLAQAVTCIAARPPTAAFAYVCTPNAVHVVNYARGETRFRAGIDGAWLRLCDSRVMARLMRLVFGIRLPLALGSDLTQRLLETVIQPDDGITVIGGDAALAAALQAQFDLRHLVWHAPPFGFTADPQALQACIDVVRAHPARFVFLACGAPQSEYLGLRLIQQGGATGTGLCIGASLLFTTGLAARAPGWWQRAGLEWLHRLIQEPGRMGRRLVQSQLPLLLLIARYRCDSSLRFTQRPPT